MAKKCKTIMQSVAHCVGKPELPGIRPRVYAVSKGDIAKWGVLQKDENGRVISNIYKGDHSLDADANFIYFDIDPLRSQHTSEAQGEMPSQTQLNKLTLVLPGVDEEASAVANFLNNNDILYIFQDANGKYRCVGSEAYPTSTKVSQDNGQGPTSQVGTTLTIEATDVAISPFYVGKITTADGEIDCSGAEE